MIPAQGGDSPPSPCTTCGGGVVLVTRGLCVLCEATTKGDIGDNDTCPSPRTITCGGVLVALGLCIPCGVTVGGGIVGDESRPSLRTKCGGVFDTRGLCVLCGVTVGDGIIVFGDLFLVFIRGVSYDASVPSSGTTASMELSSSLVVAVWLCANFDALVSQDGGGTSSSPRALHLESTTGSFSICNEG